MKKLVVSGFIVVSAFFLSSCASIVAGGPSVLQANSNPAGATVTAKGLNNGESLSGQTPTSFTLNKGSDYELTFELEGYRSEVIVVRRTINGWFWGNFLLGLVPMIIDAATSNMWQHTMSIAEVDFTMQTANTDGSITAQAVVVTYNAEGKQQFNRVPITFYKL
jgi:PEGA domain